MSRRKSNHNKGQSDGSKGKYRPPHSRVEDLVRHIVAGEGKRERGERKSYDKGHKHGKRQKGGCFLTTACVEHAGLADDCRELQVLRRFRDTFVASHPRGDAMLREYYRNAPGIVRRIQSSPERSEVLAAVFATVEDAVVLIEAHEPHQALDAYTALFMQLRTRYPREV